MDLKLKSTGEELNKKQIILCHTSREVEEYLTSLLYRYNSKFDKIPNYVIKKNGEIVKLLKDEEYSNLFKNHNINKFSIIISLENLGWLEKTQLKNEFINWKGTIYKDKVFEKKWRDYAFWDKYSDEQYSSLLELCDVLLNKFDINKNVIEHNAKIDGIENFSGIVSKSNFSFWCTELNPSFQFEKLKKLENGKYTQR